MSAKSNPERALLGPRLRVLRHSRGWSLQRVADAAHCSRSFLSMLERGQTDVSASLLGRIAAAFNLSVADLVPDTTQTEYLKVVRHQEAPTYELADGVRADVPFAGVTHTLQLVVLTLEPGAHHQNEIGHAGEEVVYVLGGEVRLSVHDAPPRILRRGDSATYPSALRHAFANPGDARAVLLTISSPPRLV